MSTYVSQPASSNFLKRLFVFILSVIVSVFFSWIALRDTPIEDVTESIKQANPIWLLIAFVAATGGVWARAVRWRGLLNFRISTTQAFHLVNITFLLNQLPLRAGETARSLLVTRLHVPVLTAAASIVVERLLDTLLVVLVLTGTLALLPDAPEQVTRAAAFFGSAAFIGFCILLFFANKRSLAHRLLGLTRWIPLLERLPLTRLLDHTLDGLHPLTNRKSGSHAIGWTLISWFFSLLTLYALYRSLDISNVNLVLGTALGIGLASFSIAIPVSVASIGPFEASFLLTGQILGIDNTTALSLGLLAHGIGILGYVIWGTVGFLSLSKLEAKTLQSEDTIGETKLLHWETPNDING